MSHLLAERWTKSLSTNNILNLYLYKETEKDTVIKERIATMLPLLNERQSRIYLAAEAKSIGWGANQRLPN